jgi:phage terminase large subunit GpA-like protein
MIQSNIALSILRKAARLAAPPPSLKVSQWADQYRQLSSEASAEPGKWLTDRAPYQREIMDSLGDPAGRSRGGDVVGADRQNRNYQ